MAERNLLSSGNGYNKAITNTYFILYPHLGRGKKKFIKRRSSSHFFDFQKFHESRPEKIYAWESTSNNCALILTLRLSSIPKRLLIDFNSAKLIHVLLPKEILDIFTSRKATCCYPYTKKNLEARCNLFDLRIKM